MKTLTNLLPVLLSVTAACGSGILDDSSRALLDLSIDERVELCEATAFSTKGDKGGLVVGCLFSLSGAPCVQEDFDSCIAEYVKPTCTEKVAEDPLPTNCTATVGELADCMTDFNKSVEGFANVTCSTPEAERPNFEVPSCDIVDEKC